MITSSQKEIIKSVTKKLQPTLVGIFGSYARGEETKESDLDILVDFETKVNLLEIIGMEQELSSQLGIKVDLITLRSLRPLLRPGIEEELIRLI